MTITEEEIKEKATTAHMCNCKKKQTIKYAKRDWNTNSVRITEGDAGYDLYTEKDIWMFPLWIKKIPLNIRCEIPYGFYGFVTSRSGFSSKGVVVIPGIVDPSYRGQINAITVLISLLPRKIPKGTRLCQMVIHSYQDVKFKKTGVLNRKERGSNGFAHSGDI